MKKVNLEIENWLVSSFGSFDCHVVTVVLVSILHTVLASSLRTVVVLSDRKIQHTDLCTKECISTQLSKIM